MEAPSGSLAIPRAMLHANRGARTVTAADALQMPAHRRRSVELSEMAKPILLSEAIKSQKAAVNIVSSVP
jgi:hypothetical protein